MLIKNITFLFAFVLLHSCNYSTKEKKIVESKTVCSEKIPSRYSAISTYKKPDSTLNYHNKKKLSCCKGVPSRFKALSSISQKE